VRGVLSLRVACAAIDTDCPTVKIVTPPGRALIKILGMIVVAGAMLASTSAFAKCDRYGNCYYGSGSGLNTRTGISWYSTNNSYGSSGYNSKGRYYNYNRSTGSYYNYGTGEYRIRGPRY
jgi:hypothetical protein